MAMQRGLWQILALALVSGALAACGPAEPSPAPEAGSEPEELRLSGTTPDGRNFEAQIGGAVRLPDAFPDDVPVYPGAEPTGALSAEGEGVMATLRSSAAPEAILDFYRDALAGDGWSIESERNFGRQRQLSATKDERRVSIQLSGDDTATQIVITVERRR